MPSPRETLEYCFGAAVAAADPQRALATALAGEPVPRGPVYIVAAGKAAAAMAEAVVRWLESNRLAPAGGVIVSNVDGPAPHRSLQRLVGEHPVPAAGSHRAAETIHHLVGTMPSDATVLVALSGGTSSLIAGPLPGLAMADVTAAFEVLLRSGLDIDAVNAIRKRITRWSAGRLALACQPGTVRCWAISDVPGDASHVIGSGPCTADPWTRDRVAALLDAGDLRSQLPAALAAAFVRETLKPDQLQTPDVTVVASNADARLGAARGAQERGLVQRIADGHLTGEAADIGRTIATQAMRTAREWHTQNEALRDEGLADRVRPLLLIWGGETTVALGDSAGRGGRNQELALAAARMLEVSPHPVTILAAGTDGRDGATDAAGAVVDPASWQQLIDAGISPDAALAAHDAYPALDAIGALLRTGPTGTNVMDLVLALIDDR